MARSFALQSGTERVAAQTLERARELKLEVHMLPAWYDIDDVEGLRRLHRMCIRRITLPSPPV